MASFDLRCQLFDRVRREEISVGRGGVRIADVHSITLDRGRVEDGPYRARKEIWGLGPLIDGAGGKNTIGIAVVCPHVFGAGIAPITWHVLEPRPGLALTR